MKFSCRTSRFSEQRHAARLRQRNLLAWAAPVARAVADRHELPVSQQAERAGRADVLTMAVLNRRQSSVHSSRANTEGPATRGASAADSARICRCLTAWSSRCILRVVTTSATGGDALPPRRAVPFEQLPLAARDEVKWLAKRGSLHPDPMIAASSLDWAQRARRVRGRAGFAAALAVEATISIALNDASGGVGWPERFAYRRTAKRLIRLAKRSGWQPPAWASVPEDRGPMISAEDLIRREGRSDLGSSTSV